MIKLITTKPSSSKIKMFFELVNKTDETYKLSIECENETISLYAYNIDNKHDKVKIFLGKTNDFRKIVIKSEIIAEILRSINLQKTLINHS